MNTMQIVEKLLAQKAKKMIQITPDTLLEDLGIDSMDLMDIILTLEETMNLTFEDETLLKLVTVQDVLDLTEQKFN